jgi:hypothetical protein
VTKDEEIRAVTAELNGLLDQLDRNVKALNAILVPSPPNSGPQEKEPVP